jgi:hypothetical protein
VDLVQVDVLELQALQAGLHAVHDVAARIAPRVGPRPHVARDLGGHDDAVARHLQVLQCLSGDLLGYTGRVDVGGVDEVDAGVQRLADQPLGVSLLQLADLGPQAGAAAEGHGAQAELRHEQAGAAQGFVAHGRRLSGSKGPRMIPRP